MATFTLSQEQYESLIALAQASTVNPDGSINQDKALVLDAALRDIESANGVTRYSLFIRWQDPLAPLPPGVNFPATWPPTLQFFLQLVTRPISKADVLTVVQQRTPKALNVMVTPDPAGLVGWTQIDAYFVQP